MSPVPFRKQLTVEREFWKEHPGEPFDEGAFARSAPVFSVERYQDTIAEVRLLYPAHWAEIALDHAAIPLEPDYERYDALAAAGILHLVTARVQRELIGYHLSMIHGHLHYKSSLTCFTDIFYLKPEHRNGFTGYKMLKFFRDSVRTMGVQKVYMGTKLSHDIGPLLERLGFKAIERIYSQVFIC